jgi:AsmA protein
MPTHRIDRLQAVLHKLRAVLTWRVALFVVFVLVVFAGAQRLLGALFVSPDMVRTQIEETLRRQTGLEFQVVGDTTVRFWPSPLIVMKDAEVFRPDGNPAEPLLHVDAISGKFDVLSALTGSPQFGGVVLTRPTFNIVRTTAGTFEWQAPDSSTNASGHTRLDTLHVGRIRIADGSVQFRQQDGVETRLTALNGTLDFSSLSNAVSFDFKTNSGGRDIAVSGSVQSPSKLLSGDNSDVSLKLSTEGLNAGFSGTANVGQQGFLSGSLDASMQDAGAAARWLGLRYPVVDNLKIVDFKASVASEGMKYTLSNLVLQLADHQATGVLTVGWTKRGAPPFLTGTLAFDRFDGGGFLTAFVPAAADLPEAPVNLDTAFLREFQVDLRISASKAAFGNLALNDMAAGVRIMDGHASFAVASGQIGNGTISAEVSVDEDAQRGARCKFTLQGHNVDLATLPGVLNLGGPWPQATANVEIDLGARLPVAPSGRAETSGTIKVTGGAGKLSGFDPDVFRELSGQKRFFDLSKAAATPMKFDSFQMSAVIDNGIAELHDATFKSTAGDLALTGVIPYKNRSLALSGTLGAPSGSNAAATRFFAGGAWPTILISPLAAVLNGQ